MSTPPYSVGVVTTSRADFSIYASLLNELDQDADISMGLYVSGMHLSPDFGLTVKSVEAAGYPIWDKVECLMSSDSPEGISKSMGMATSGFAQSFARRKPDLLIVLGDRFEMHAVAVAALPFNIPLAHIHGGEETEGAMDNSLRHCISKLSHLHFPSTKLSEKRLQLMGEQPANICAAGAPALDSILSTKLLSRSELSEQFGIPDAPFILITYHPVTLETDGGQTEFEELWSALQNNPQPVVFTLANADQLGRAINQRIRDIVSEHPQAFLVENMGATRYYSAMACAHVMVGNSSSGIIEAASFELPVVNVGDRQKGRERSANVIDVEGTVTGITQGLVRANDPAFRKILKTSGNIYGDGQAAERILEKTKAALKAGINIKKPFHFPDDT